MTNLADEIIEAKRDEGLDAEDIEWTPLPKVGEFALNDELADKLGLQRGLPVTADEFTELVCASKRLPAKKSKLRPELLEAISSRKDSV